MIWSKKFAIILVFAIFLGAGRLSVQAIAEIEAPREEAPPRIETPRINSSPMVKTYDFVDESNPSRPDGLMRVRSGNLWGFVNKDRVEVIPLVYTSLDLMVYGIAAASRGQNMSVELVGMRRRTGRAG